MKKLWEYFLLYGKKFLTFIKEMYVKLRARAVQEYAELKESASKLTLSGMYSSAKEETKRFFISALVLKLLGLSSSRLSKVVRKFVVLPYQGCVNGGVYPLKSMSRIAHQVLHKQVMGTDYETFGFNLMGAIK